MRGVLLGSLFGTMLAMSNPALADWAGQLNDKEKIEKFLKDNNCSSNSVQCKEWEDKCKADPDKCKKEDPYVYYCRVFPQANGCKGGY